MKSWQPDDVEQSDPFLGGLVSRRAELVIAGVALIVFAAAWRMFGLQVALGVAFVIVLVWSMIFG